MDDIARFNEFRAAFSVAEVSSMTSLSKPFLRLEIKSGRLAAKRFGRRVLVLPDDLKTYLQSEPKTVSEK